MAAQRPRTPCARDRDGRLRLSEKGALGGMRRPRVRELIALWRETVSRWSADNASRLAAALAYYALLSMAPLLVVTVLVMGLVFGIDDGRARTIGALSSVVGPEGTAALETLAESANRAGDTTLGSVLAILVALFGASGVFVELQASLNTIWEVPAREEPVVVSYVVGRFWSFTMVLAAASLLLLSVISSAVIAIVTEFFESALPGGELVWQWLNFGASLGVLTLIFALIFRIVPDTQIRWGDVWLGAFFTALLFTVGNVLLGFYLGTSGITSSFGGAGSVVALVIWVYYSAQIVFFGAEFTHVYAHRFGSRQSIVPG
ncbi:MAG: YihY/virulence factor BrkB family protein [Polyangiales bacterium]